MRTLLRCLLLCGGFRRDGRGNSAGTSGDGFSPGVTVCSSPLYAVRNLLDLLWFVVYLFRVACVCRCLQLHFTPCTCCAVGAAFERGVVLFFTRLTFLRSAVNVNVPVLPANWKMASLLGTGRIAWLR